MRSGAARSREARAGAADTGRARGGAAPRRASGWWASRLEQARRAVVFQRTALASWLAWPVAYPAAWIWRRTWLRRTRVVAVTGSYGKTSTAAAVAAAVGAGFDPDGANYGSFLAAALLRHRPRRRCLAVEVGISRPGQMRGYARLLRPDVVVLTAIGKEHLRLFGTQEALAREKALLPRAVGPRGLVVVNGDDERCRAIGARLPARVVRVGYAADCDWRIEEATVDWPRGTNLRLAGPAGSLTIRTRWIGRDLARCTALAAAAALESGEGAGVDAVAARLAALAPTSGRLEPILLPGGAWLLCDAWKSSWDVLESALRELAGLAGFRRVAVLGEVEDVQGGQVGVYRRYGLLAAAAADRILFVGGATNYRRFLAGLRKAEPPAAAPAPASAVERCRDAHDAARALRDDLGPATVILVKGRHSQKLGRLPLLLRGAAVACRLRHCPARGLRCELCPRLSRASGAAGRESAAPDAARAAP